MWWQFQPQSSISRATISCTLCWGSGWVTMQTTPPHWPELLPEVSRTLGIQQSKGLYSCRWWFNPHPSALEEQVCSDCAHSFLLRVFQRGRQRSSALWSWSEQSCRLRSSRTARWRTASAPPCRHKAGALCGAALGRRCCETCPSQLCTGTTTRRAKSGCVSALTQESPHLPSPSHQEQFPAP